MKINRRLLKLKDFYPHKTMTGVIADERRRKDYNLDKYDLYQ